MAADAGTFAEAIAALGPGYGLTLVEDDRETIRVHRSDYRLFGCYGRYFVLRVRDLHPPRYLWRDGVWRRTTCGDAPCDLDGWFETAAEVADHAYVALMELGLA